jgi:threonine/homoserine/homoserine lactone efflux protein
MAILAGLFFGIMSAVPIGPVGILAIAQRYRHGFWRGYSVSLASAALEAVYSLVAVEAADFVKQVLLRYSHIMKFAGTAVLVGVGIGILRQARTFDPAGLADANAKKELHPVIKTIALHLSSPTIPVYCLAAAGLVVAYGWVVRGHVSAVLFAVASGIGVAVWCFILLRFILRKPQNLKAGTFRTMFLVLAVVLMVLAVLNLVSVWVEFPGPFKTG